MAREVGGGVFMRGVSCILTVQIWQPYANWQLKHWTNVVSDGFGRYKKNHVPLLLNIILQEQRLMVG